MKVFYLVPFLFLTACTEQQTPNNLRIVEVELAQVDNGFKSSAFVWLKDSDRGVTLKQKIYCYDWDKEDDLREKDLAEV